jgi:hypothetical protein
MTSVARRRNEQASEASLHQDGYVVHVAGPWITVRIGAGERRARRALSCLVAPALGDRVLVASLADGSAWALAVLEREEDGAVTLDARGRSVAIEAQDGRVDVVAPGGVGVATNGPITMSGATFALHAVDASITLDKLTMLAQRVLADAKKSTLVAGIVETVADVVVGRMRRAVRSVTEVDQLRAGHADYEVDKAMRVHAENTFLTAERVVKLDGENIHLG